MKVKEIPPVMEPLEELEKSRIAYSLRIITSVTVALLLILSVSRLLIHRYIDISDYLLWLMIGFIIVLGILSRKSKNRYSGLFFVVITWIPLTIMAWTHSGVKDIAIVAYIVCILFAMNITLYWQANIVFIISLISIWAILYAEQHQMIVTIPDSSLNYTIEYTIILGLLIVIININRRNQLFYYKSIQKEFNEKITVERSLRKSEEQFRDLVENINDIFFTLDKDGIITYISPQINQVYDYKYDDLIGHPFSEIIYADDLDELLAGFKETKENRVKPREFRYQDRDKQIRWAQTSSRPIIENGQVVGVRGLFSDITSRKLAEQEFQKLSMAVVQSPASILITNLSGEIEYVNPRFCQITGYSLGDVIGRNPSILKSGNTPKEVYQDLWSKISTGKEWKGEFYNKKKNGELFWEAATISPIINSKGELTHYLAIKEDITERKEATRRVFDIIIETEERERLRYSHELHDGLGPILSTINLYFQMLAENTEADQKDIIITRASSCIDEAIKTIKEISYNLSPSVLSNFGIVSGINNFINRLNATEKLYIDFNSNFDGRFEKNLEITIYRIVTELINNTIKYAGASRVEIILNYCDETHGIILDYSDNGGGFNLENALSAKKGLGLSNIYQRVNTLNGIINVETGPDKGIRVHIEFPVLK